ncbi:unnamed protein product [marine sediment metagenome]|uniref:Isochorismatase-like domain-containing protein n=1 Tax=marine sediment metagenome TaxID=412755 RepID=X1J654_9ZZZZ
MIERTSVAKKGLIIVDMLKDFMEEKGALFCGNECRKIIPFVVDTLENMRNEGATIIFRTVHTVHYIRFEA